jgi:hypothetical protein
MDIAYESLTRVDVALSCARKDAKHRAEHLEAAIRATGDLQRALILEQMILDPPHHQKTGV